MPTSDDAVDSLTHHYHHRRLSLEAKQANHSEVTKLSHKQQSVPKGLSPNRAGYTKSGRVA